jgi:hypothetical protein
LILKQPLYRNYAKIKQFVEALQKIAAKSQPQKGLYVSAKRPQPVSLSLPAESLTAPYSISDPVTKTIENNPYRHMMPGPVTKGAQPVNTATIGANISF